jgi:hypothetical protein
MGIKSSFPQAQNKLRENSPSTYPVQGNLFGNINTSVAAPSSPPTCQAQGNLFGNINPPVVAPSQISSGTLFGNVNPSAVAPSSPSTSQVQGKLFGNTNPPVIAPSQVSSGALFGSMHPVQKQDPVPNSFSSNFSSTGQSSRTSPFGSSNNSTLFGNSTPYGGQSLPRASEPRSWMGQSTTFSTEPSSQASHLPQTLQHNANDPTCISQPIKEMNLAPGGLIGQTVKRDTRPPSIWDTSSTILFNVQILNAESFNKVTGLPPPHTPVDSRMYAQYGIPWVSIWDSDFGIDVGKGFEGIKSIAEIDGAMKQIKVAESGTPDFWEKIGGMGNFRVASKGLSTNSTLPQDDDATFKDVKQTTDAVGAVEPVGNTTTCEGKDESGGEVDEDCDFEIITLDTASTPSNFTPRAEMEKKLTKIA